MITYPVSPETRWAILQISTGEIISRNKPWPVANGMEIPGLDPDFVYLQQVKDAKPEVDARLFSLQSTEVIDAAANEIRTTWQAVERPLEDAEVNLANVEANELEKLVGDNRFKKLVILALFTLFRQLSNQELTAQELAIKRAIIAKGKAAMDNDKRHAALKALLIAGEKPDLDTGWAEAPADED